MDNLLVKAVKDKKFETVELLLKMGANPNSLDKNGKSVLLIAAERGYADIANTLLLNDADPNLTLKNNITALSSATIEGYNKIAKLLLESNANLEATDIKGRTALYLAASKGNEYLVKLFLGYGANKNISANGISLSRLALKQENSAIAKMILKDKPLYDSESFINPPAEFLKAVTNGDALTVKKLIALNSSDIHKLIKNTPQLLYFAVQYSYTKIVSALLDNGSSTDFVSKNGVTSLYFASLHGHFVIVKLLLDAGADKDASVGGNTPLGIAILNEDIKTVEVLLRAGAKTTCSTHNSCPINFAYEIDSAQIKNMVYNSYARELNYNAAIERSHAGGFEVVIARDNDEDVSWIPLEFPHDKVTVYNKGADNINLPSQYEVIKLPNIGNEANTYLYHIITNYENLHARILFSQADPYGLLGFFPLNQYKEKNISSCKNLITECFSTSIKAESDKLLNSNGATKWHDIIPRNKSMIEYSSHYFGKRYWASTQIDSTYGSTFAIDKENILCHSLDFHKRIKEALNDEYSVTARYIASLWDEWADCSNSTAVNLDSPIVSDYLDVMQMVYNNEYFSDIVPKWEQYLLLNYNQKTNNIPFYLNIVWLTKNHDPSEMSLEVLNNLRQNIKLLNEGPNQWKLFLWLHNQDLTPETVKFCNTISSCYIREISELTSYEQSKVIINRLVNNNLFSPASDFVRANVMNDVGGIYADIDIAFKNSPAILHHYFDFYAGFERDGWQKQIGTGFFAARPNHPIIINYLAMIKTTYGIENAKNLPYYLNDIVSCNSAATMTGGPFSLTASYYVNNNINDNKDIIFQKHMIHEPEEGAQALLLDGKNAIIPKISTQNYHASWVGVCDKKYVNLKDDIIFTPKDKNLCDQSQPDFGIANAIDKILKSSNNLVCHKNASIEFVSHRAWLTNPDKPTLLNNEVLKITQKSINMLDNSGQAWTHYWWALKDEHFTEEMKLMFNKNNIMLKTVDELYPFYPGLEKAISNAGKLSYSLSVDILKWVVIHHYGGMYTDIDYEILSTQVLHELHHCSKTYFSHKNYDYILNGILGSESGGIIAKEAADEYIRLLVNEPKKFQHCRNQDQIMRMNLYGHVKPFIDSILSEHVDASSIILVPLDLMVDKTEKCLTVKYGNIHLKTLGFDYRFQTWSSSDAEVNTRNMQQYSDYHKDGNESSLIGDLCELQ